jgi:protein-tyrosine-phosphatase
MRARQVTKEDFYDTDYIIGMDQENVSDLQAMAPAGTEDKIYLPSSLDAHAFLWPKCGAALVFFVFQDEVAASDGASRN